MNVFSIFMPYCIKRLSPKLGIILNRQYQPPGYFNPDRPDSQTNYATANGTFRISKPGWFQLSQMLDSPIHNETPDLIHLYDSVSNPFHLGKFRAGNWANYCRKLATLSRLKFYIPDG